MVSLAVYAEFCRRMGICRACPAYSGGRVPRCKACGCLLDVKARLGGTSCPEGKW